MLTLLRTEKAYHHTRSNHDWRNTNSLVRETRCVAACVDQPLTLNNLNSGPRVRHIPKNKRVTDLPAMSPISTLRATGSCDVRQGAIVLGADPSLADLDGHLAVAKRAALAFSRNGADVRDRQREWLQTRKRVRRGGVPKRTLRNSTRRVPRVSGQFWARNESVRSRPSE
jgi:hypothetical protein